MESSVHCSLQQVRNVQGGRDRTQGRSLHAIVIVMVCVLQGGAGSGGRGGGGGQMIPFIESEGVVVMKRNCGTWWWNRLRDR